MILVYFCISRDIILHDKMLNFRDSKYPGVLQFLKKCSSDTSLFFRIQEQFLLIKYKVVQQWDNCVMYLCDCVD